MSRGCSAVVISWALCSAAAAWPKCAAPATCGWAATWRSSSYGSTSELGVAVMAAPDAIREEEVLASIVLVPGETASDELCSELFDFCQKEMAYYKVPGWWWFTSSPM